MTTDPISMPTRELPLEYRLNIAYFKLAYQCMLPAAKALSAGKQDIDALLAVAFSPVMHALLACMAPTNAWGTLFLLQRLVRPQDSYTFLQLGTPQEVWTSLNTLRNGTLATGYRTKHDCAFCPILYREGGLMSHDVNTVIRHLSALTGADPRKAKLPAGKRKLRVHTQRIGDVRLITVAPVRGKLPEVDATTFSNVCAATGTVLLRGILVTQRTFSRRPHWMRLWPRPCLHTRV